MINAGADVLGFTGTQRFNPDTALWEGIVVEIRYSSADIFTAPPPSVGDVLIEPTGNAWGVANVDQNEEGQWVLDLDAFVGETTAEVVPGFGESSSCAITTPRKGFIAPHFDASLVDPACGRIAQMLTMQTIEFPTGDGSSELPDDVWSGDVELS